MRRRLIAIWILLLFIFMASFTIVPISESKEFYHYFTTNFYRDTGALNAVTGIYLDYRVFDTLFETLLLLISVIGIIHFSRHEGEY